MPCRTPGRPPVRLAACSPSEALARGLDADQATSFVIEEGVEQAHRVRAAADAGDQQVGQAAVRLEHLGAGLRADHRLEIAHHRGIGVRAGRPCR